MKNEREFIAKKIAEQRIKKENNQKNLERGQQHFKNFADKERLQSVNVYIPERGI